MITGLFALLFLGLCSAPAFAAVELAHDKSNAESFRTLGGRYGFAVSFSPPNSAWPVQRIRIYGLRVGNQTEPAAIEIEIWSENLTTLYTSRFPYSLFRSAPSWAAMDVAGPTVSGTFFIVLYPGTTARTGIQIGVDTTVVNTRSELVSGKIILKDWTEARFAPPLKKEEANWMIRVVGGGGALSPISTVTTATTTSGTTFLGINMSTLQQIGGVAATGGAALFGWFFKTRKRRFLSGYLMKVDSTYNEYSMNREECKRRLTQMKEESIQLLKKGQIDEPHFTLIDNKLTQYLKDLGEGNKQTS
jgi:hypothetical protein